MLNMFRELLCPSSGALEYMCVVTAYGVQCLVVGCRGSSAGQQGVFLVGSGVSMIRCGSCKEWCQHDPVYVL